MYPLVAHTLTPLLVALAVTIGVAGFVGASARAGAGMVRPLAGAFLVALGAVVGGRVYWLVEQGWDLPWSELLLPGLRHPGIVIGMLVAVPISSWLLPVPVPLRRLLDLAAPWTALAYAVGRLGCFIAGCCFGTRSALPWALSFPPSSPAAHLHEFRAWIPDGLQGSLPVHPLQLYFVGLAVGVGLFLFWFQRRKAYDGQVVLLLLAVHESGKFLLESLREPELGSVVSRVPMASLAVALLAWATLFAIAMLQRRWTPAPTPAHP